MKTIQITGGYSGIVSGTISDDFMSDLSSATLRILLVPVTGSVPVLSDPGWMIPAVDTSSLGSIRWHITVNNSTAPGTYKVYGSLTLNGVTELVLSSDYVRTV